MTDELDARNRAGFDADATATVAAATRGDTLTPSESFGYMVNLVARLYARTMGREMARHGAQMGYFPILLALWREGSATQSWLAAEAQIEQPTVAATLSRMERDGLVRRSPDPHDRRATRITLTTEGEALREPLTAAARRVNARSLAGLTRVSAADLLAALHELAAGLSAGEA